MALLALLATWRFAVRQSICESSVTQQVKVAALKNSNRGDGEPLFLLAASSRRGFKQYKAFVFAVRDGHKTDHPHCH